MFKKTINHQPSPSNGKNGKNDHNQKNPGHLIELSNVIKTYLNPAGDFTALKNIHLSIDSGEFVAIVGKSGSGKSTLLNMITGIDRPTSGEVWVNGTPIHTLTEGQMAKWRGLYLGIVFQFFQLMPTLTLAQNVKLPMDFCGTYPLSERQARAMHLLELVEMADHADKLPSAVSGGQQQRVAIARAMANDPPLIIADEPTGNLDSRTSDAIFTLFEDLVANDKTIIIVTHDMDHTSRVHRSITLADGKTVSDQQTKTIQFSDSQNPIQVR